MQTDSSRGMWGSRVGFILAAAGSAVGLGNVWGFPTQVGRGGGAAFVAIYLVCVFLVCVPIMAGEIALGRRSRQSPAGSFAVLAPGRAWWLAGGLAVLTGACILSFYSVIAGWTIAYVWFAATGSFPEDPDEIGRFFGDFISNGTANVGLTLLVLATTAGVLAGGVRGGIERVTKALMPALLALLVMLAFRAVTLPGAQEGLAYYLRPDLSNFADAGVFNAALGQAFFSLSLGMGCMITYGSYLGSRSGIAGATLWIALLDTGIALLAGFIIFPAGYSIAGFDPTSEGPGLIFAVLPNLFATLPGGHVFGAAFFALLGMAALTSTISLLEVPVAHCVDAFAWPRVKAVGAVTGAVFALAVPSALGNGAVGAFASMPGIGLDFLSLMDVLWSKFALPIGGLLTAVFVGWIWRADRALAELRAHDAWFPVPGLWVFLIRWISPAAIALIIAGTLVSMVSGAGGD